MSLEDDLKAPVEENWIDVDALLNGHLYKLRFTSLDGPTWANECDKCPMRPGVAIDQTYGYNLRALTFGVAPLTGKIIEPDGSLTVVNEWDDLLRKVDGQTFRRISDAIWALNEYLPSEAVKAAKKALADSATASTSHSSSASPSSGSTGGSPPKPKRSNTTKRAD